MKFLVIGGKGSIGKRHAANLLALEQEVTIFDEDIGTTYTEAEALIGDMLLDTDAVVIASPTRTHMMYLYLAGTYGKHVLVEKPIGYDCPSLISGFLMGRKETTPKQIIATAFNLRFHSCVSEAKQLIEDGMIGLVTAATFRVQQKSTKAPYLDDGVIRNWMSHEIDAARFILGGDLTVTNCDAEIKYGRDYAAKIFATCNSPHMIAENHLVIMGDYFTDPEVRNYDIYGTKGIMHIDLVKRTISIRHYLREVYDYQAEDSFDANYKDEMEAFVKACQGHGLCGLASGEDGVAALDVVMAARQKAGI